MLTTTSCVCGAPHIARRPRTKRYRLLCADLELFDGELTLVCDWCGQRRPFEPLKRIPKREQPIVKEQAISS